MWRPSFQIHYTLIILFIYLYIYYLCCRQAHLSHMSKKHGDHLFNITSIWPPIILSIHTVIVCHVFCVKNFNSYLCRISYYFVIICCTGIKQSRPSFGHFIIYFIHFIICYTLLLSAYLLPRSNCLTTIAPWYFCSFVVM